MERRPPHAVDLLEDDEVVIDLGDSLDENRSALVVGTQPFGRDHVRVACGRGFRDAAPTAGTIYRGGRRETLEIGVQVDRRVAARAASGER